MSTQVPRWLLTVCACWGAGLLAASPAAGQEALPGSVESASTGPLGAAAAPRRPRSKPRRRVKGEAVVTFPGFRLLPDGRSRVFVELTKGVTVDERREASSVIYTLHGANVPVRNNRNALVTTHFATAVARARLVPTAADVELVIELRAPVAPVHQVVATDSGGARLEVEFPAGDYPPAAERDPGPAKSRRSQRPAPVSDDTPPAEGSSPASAPP